MATDLPVLPGAPVGDTADALIAGTRVTITGRLTAGPELRYTGAGVAWARLRLALHGTEGTIHQEVLTAGDVAESSARSLRTGNRVRVKGRLRGRSWLDEEGHGCYDVDVIAEAVELLQPRAA
jgi:single-stranded DNA-binding protein